MGKVKLGKVDKTWRMASIHQVLSTLTQKFNSPSVLNIPNLLVHLRMQSSLLLFHIIYLERALRNVYLTWSLFDWSPIFEWYIAKLEIEMDIKITTVSMILDYVLKR